MVESWNDLEVCGVRMNAISTESNDTDIQVNNSIAEVRVRAEKKICALRLDRVGVGKIRELRVRVDSRKGLDVTPSLANLKVYF